MNPRRMSLPLHHCGSAGNQNLVVVRSPNFATLSVVCTHVHPQRVLSSSNFKTTSNNQGWEVYTYKCLWPLDKLVTGIQIPEQIWYMHKTKANLDSCTNQAGIKRSQSKMRRNLPNRHTRVNELAKATWEYGYVRRTTRNCQPNQPKVCNAHHLCTYPKYLRAGEQIGDLVRAMRCPGTWLPPSARGYCKSPPTAASSLGSWY